MAFLSHTFGVRTGAEANGSFLEGGTTGANEASGVDSHAEGVNTVASGLGAHAEGDAAAAGNILASGPGAHAEGRTTGAGTITAQSSGSHAEGYAANAHAILSSGLGSHAEGTGDSTASGEAAHSEGNYSVASADYSHAGGSWAEANHYGEWARAPQAQISNGLGDSQYGTISFDATTFTVTTIQEISITGLSGSDFFFLDDGDAYFCRMMGVARSTFGGDTAYFNQDFCVKNVGGTITILGGNITVAADANSEPVLAAALIDLSADSGNQRLKVEVTPVTTNIVKWQIRFDYAKVRRT